MTRFDGRCQIDCRLKMHIFVRNGCIFGRKCAKKTVKKLIFGAENKNEIRSVSDLYVIFLLPGLHPDCTGTTSTSDGSEAPGVLQVGTAVLRYKATGVAPGNISTGCRVPLVRMYIVHVVCAWNVIIHYYLWHRNDFCTWNWAISIFVATVLNCW